MSKPSGNIKIMFSLPPTLVKALKRIATERRQTNSIVVEEWIQKGVTEHDAKKVAAK
jgi:predicted transcriptional regulator